MTIVVVAFRLSITHLFTFIPHYYSVINLKCYLIHFVFASETNPLVFVSVAAGPLHSVGLVHLPGRLRQTQLQIPEGQPPHCADSARKVSPSFTPSLLFYGTVAQKAQGNRE